MDLTEEQLKLAMLAGRYTETIERRRVLVELGVSLALLWMRGQLEAGQKYAQSKYGDLVKIDDGPWAHVDELKRIFSNDNIEAIVQTAKLD